jgi:type IV pilus assembly protein PilP
MAMGNDGLRRVGEPGASCSAQRPRAIGPTARALAAWTLVVAGSVGASGRAWGAAPLGAWAAGGQGGAAAPPQKPQPTPAPPQAPVAPAPAGAPGAAQAAEPYSYDPGGRRDPFVSLIARGSELRGPANRPAGLPGLLVGEVTVRGIVKGPKGFLAMITGPDKRTYIVHPNDRLFDGTVKAITEDAVIFAQDVNDPLSLVKQREVRKPLRAGQEGK